jgi:AAA+ ATPase superfamily predicted ATPase
MIQNKFFDRKYYLDILHKRVKALNEGYRQNIAILGDELVGKTSIILHFLSRLHDNRILPVYLSLRHESLEYFAKRFIGVLLYNFLNNSGINLKEDLNLKITFLRQRRR